MGKQYVFLPGGQESEGRRNDGPRTVGIQAENRRFPILGSPAKRYISRS